MFLQIVIMGVFMSGVILILFFRHKALLRIISSFIPHTELGRSLIALFNGVGILCTAFVLGIFEKPPLLIIALTLELAGLLFALLALAFYPVSLKIATRIDEKAKAIVKDLHTITTELVGKEVTEHLITNIERTVIPDVMEKSTGVEKMFVYLFVLFYYYAYIFTLLGIISLLIGVGINI